MKELLKTTEIIRKKIEKSKGILLLFDFDGTLSPIVKNPSKAILPKRNKSALEFLLKKTDLKMAVISGRELKDLVTRVDLKDIVYAGDHGMEISYKRRLLLRKGERYIKPIANLAKDLKGKLDHIDNVFVDLKKISVAVHLRRVEKKLHSVVEQIVRKNSKEYLNRYPFKITKGKMVLEIRPKSVWNKGDASLWIWKKIGKGYLPIYMGDDVTDEDAFKVIRKGGITILIGELRRSSAQYHCDNISTVLNMLIRIYSR